MIWQRAASSVVGRVDRAEPVEGEAVTLDVEVSAPASVPDDPQPPSTNTSARVPVKIRPSVLFEVVLKTSYAYTFGVVGEWGGSGSNRRPADYESSVSMWLFGGRSKISLVITDYRRL
jgi:hypothetical protein